MDEVDGVELVLERLFVEELQREVFYSYKCRIGAGDACHYFIDGGFGKLAPGAAG